MILRRLIMKPRFSMVVWLTALAGVGVDGQITSPQADVVRQLEYPVSTETDPMFVFYQQEGDPQQGALQAGLPVAGPFDFTWTMYDPGADDFTIPVATVSGVETSAVTDLDEGGYRVAITNGTDIDTSFIAWVMLDNLRVWTEKNSEGELASFRAGCSDGNYIIIAGGVEVDTFNYYDPVTHEQVLFENDFDIRWTSDNPELTIYNATNKDAMGANYSNEPPYEDTWYILTATDSLGMSEDDSVFYDTKHTKAEFTVEYFDKVLYNDAMREYERDGGVEPDSLDEDFWVEDLGTTWSPDAGMQDAPLAVRFINESLNGYEFTWVFVDSLEEATGEQFIRDTMTMDLDSVPRYTYRMADEFYYPYLVSESDAGCVDTFRLEDGIQVVGSELLVPNFFSPVMVNSAFSPNDDGYNDIWKLKHQSIKECKLTIVNRRGQVIYRKNIEDMYAWEGWRGTILNTNREAPAGQYYYVVEALGYDDEEFKNPNVIEQWKLDRQQGGGSGQNPDGEEEVDTSADKYVGWIYLFRE